MADTVQYKLELMINELDALERRGLFTHREILEVVKQRRKFEYRLKRPSPLKQDYLAYIEYETQLDSLRRLRKRAVGRELKTQGKKMRRSSADYAIAARIVEIYRLATTRYKGDIDLWYRYLEFCRQRKSGRMKKVLAQVIRFHPKVPGVWIYAAAWEFDHNLNVTAARALMQNGLRVCPTSEDLWVEYLRMELTYLNKLKARKVALGEDKGTLIRDPKDADEKQWRDENKDLFMLLDDEKGNNDGSNIKNEELEMKVDLFQEQGASVLRTIYSGAVETLPSCFSLRKRFLEILEATDLAHSEAMRNEILNDMKRDFSADPAYWDWLAKLEMTDIMNKQEISEDIALNQLQKAIQVYEEAVKVVSSSTMFNLYTSFLMDFIAPRQGENQVSGLSKDFENLVSHLLKVYENAESIGCMTEDLACQYVSFYLQLGRVNEAREHAKRLCGGKFSSSVQLWVLWISIEVRCATRDFPSKQADMLPVFELLKHVLTKFSISEAETLWHMAFKLFADQRHYFDKLVEIAVTSVAKYRGSETGFSLSCSIVNFVLQKDGIQHAREMYKRFFALPHPGLALYKNCIELEASLAFVGDRDCFLHARKLYESALTTYDQNVNLWRDYYSMESKLGTSETASAVYWRARKSLKDSVAFTISEDILQ